MYSSHMAKEESEPGSGFSPANRNLRRSLQLKTFETTGALSPKNKQRYQDSIEADSSR